MAFLGMRGDGDWATDQRPKNWRQMILYLYPNGSTPLTGILSQMSSESVDDPEFNWWTKDLQQQGGSITNVYTDSGLSSAVTSGTNSTSGDTVYVKAAEAVIDHFRVGHQAKIGKDDDYRVNTVGEVTDVVRNGADSYVAVKLSEDADTTAGLDTADNILIVGNVNSEGATMPDAISYDPVKHFNYTQIFRTPLSITRTARETRLRTGDAYQEAKREALEYHAIEMERAFIFSARNETTGANGKPKRSTQGIQNAIVANHSAGVSDFKRDSSFSGDTWLQSGKEWLDNQLEVIFRHGDPEKLALVGSQALQAVNRLAETHGHVNIEPMEASFGIKVLQWVTPFGTVFLKTHPLFTDFAGARRNMLILEPRRLRTRFITDTTFKEEGESVEEKLSNSAKDATEEEYLGELGLEYHHTATMGLLTNLGKDNTV